MALPQGSEIPEREFERIVLAERSRLVRIVTQIVGASEAEDICQEALMHALRAREQFRYRSSVQAWLVRIAQNCAHDVLRKRKRAAHACANGTGQKRGVANPTARLEVDRAFERVPTQFREPLAMFLWGYTYREIASLLGIPMGTVMSRIHRARRHAAAPGLAGASFFLAELTQLGYTKLQSGGPIV